MYNFLSRLLEPKSNPVEAAVLTAKILNVRLSATTLKNDIEQHPDYPSLLSISDIYSNYGIENMGVRVAGAEISTLESPFIAQINGTNHSGNFFSVVRSIKNSQIEFFDPEKKTWILDDIEAFEAKFSGIALLVNATSGAGERNYERIRKNERNTSRLINVSLLLIPVFTLLVGIDNYISFGLSAVLSFLFSVLSLTGSTVGALLLWYEIDLHNPLLKQICTAGRKANCGAILQSNASKIFGLSWSTIGFSYFTGLLFAQLLLGSGNHILSLLACISLLAAAYVPFSLYYQWKIAKQWCVLCLSVQAILFLQLLTSVSSRWMNSDSLSSISVHDLIVFTLCFLFPLALILILLPILKGLKETKLSLRNLQRLQHNSEIFTSLLTKQKKLLHATDGLGIKLGNPDSQNKLIKVCAPYCQPCSKAHALIEDIIENNPDLQLQIIYNSYGHGYDAGAAPVKHFLAIDSAGIEETTKKVLDHWYGLTEKDYDKFAQQHPVAVSLDEQLPKITAMRDWCDKVDIAYTPTFFFNGYQLPEGFNISDLKYFLKS